MADADAAKQWLQHSTSERKKRNSDLGEGVGHSQTKDAEDTVASDTAVDNAGDGRRALSDEFDDEQEELLQSPDVTSGRRPTIVVVHLPLFTQWCGGALQTCADVGCFRCLGDLSRLIFDVAGADSIISCTAVVRIGAMCAEQWVPLFDQLGVDLVIAHHSVGISAFLFLLLVSFVQNICSDCSPS